MMNRKKESLLLLKMIILLLICTACAGLILYEKRLPHTHVFNHKLHTTEVGLDCTFCHSTVMTDGVETYGMLPKMSDCLMCHQEKFDTQECQFCHQTQEPGPFQQIPVHTHLHFSHEQHLGLEDWELQCLDCHAQAHTVTKAGQEKLPPMQLCLSCHQEWFDELDCLNCHNGFQKIDLVPLSEFSHTGNFTEIHGPIAKAQEMTCAMCHDQAFCTECHRKDELGLSPNLLHPEQSTRQWIHEGDFLSRHFIEARFNSAQCITCHSQSFCRDCHVHEGIADVNAGLRTDLAADPHPLGFGFREDPTSPNFHGRIARREIFTCASCHDNGADTICLECHATIEKGGWGVNPHPFGFQSHLRKTRDRVCLACHVN